MNVRRFGLVAVCLLVLVAAPALALQLGDDAPPLKIKKWFKGDAVSLADGKGKNVFVIEFWATWCGPCIRGMPHVSKLQKQYQDKGLVVVGVTNEDPRQSAAAIEKWVRNMGFVLQYTAALDDDHATERAYMDAFKKEGIPQCFVVDKQGKLVWEGHPMFGLDAVVAAVLNGESDVKKLGELGQRAAEQREAELLKQQELMSQYFQMMAKETPAPEAAELGKKVLAAHRDDPMALNELSWTILTHPLLKSRDLALALEAAQVANEAMHGQDPSVLDTYALALFKNKKVKEAVAAQKQAIELVGDSPALREDFEKRLREYEAGDKK